ncbi:Regulatory protein BlaR1 [Gimesia panareensis]|nr:Regulatory protein BlaR1 [Gimesia panareensis]
MTSAGFMETILSLSLQITILICVAGGLSMTLKSFSNEYRLWALCHVLILLQFLAAFSLPHPRLLSNGFTQPPQYIELVQKIESTLGQVILIIWLCGMMVSMFALIMSTFRTIRVLNNSTVSAVELIEQGLLDDVNGKTVKLLISQAVQTPFCWQIHTPVIVLPERVLALSTQELSMIVRHEIEHLQAGHPLQLFLQRLVEALFWFHPLVWWSSRQAVRSREFYCDQKVVHDREDILIYLKSMLHLVENQVTDWKTLSAGFAYRNSSSLIQQRIQHLTATQQKHSDSQQRLSWRGPCILLTALFCILLWLPVDVSASNRSFWSPWPRWSTNLLQSVGIPARDYEIDGHRLRPHEHP